MKKIINLRIILFVCIALVVGCFVGGYYWLIPLWGKITLLSLLIFIGIFPLLCKLLHSTILVAISKNSFIIITLVITLFVGYFTSCIQVMKFQDYEANGELQFASGRVCDIVRKEEYNIVTLENMSFVKESQTTYSKNKLKIIISSTDNWEIDYGDTLALASYIDDIPLISSNKINSNTFFSKVAYYCFTQYDSITINAGSKNLQEIIKQKVQQVLENSMQDDVSVDFAFSSLFGKTQYIDESLYSDFQVLGIAHLLSVSGLHVGFLVAIIVWLLKKFKANSIIQFVVSLIFLFMYSYICGFAPSIVRASIMFLVLILGTLLGRKTDSLCSLCFAGIIILIVWPLSVYSVSFQLSFSCMLGIILLSKPICNLLEKVKILRIISKPLAISIAIQIFALPLFITYFEGFSLMTVFANLVIIPLFGIMFSTLFIGVLFTSLLPFMAFILYFTEILITIISLIANFFVYNLNIYIISKYVFTTISAILYFVLLFVISKYVMLSKKAKILTSLSLCILCAITFVLTNIPAVSKVNAINLIDQNQFYVQTETNTKVLVNACDSYSVKKYLKSRNIHYIDAIIISDYDVEYQTELIYLMNYYKVQTLIVCEIANDADEYSLLKSLLSSVDYISMASNSPVVYKDFVLTNFQIEQDSTIVNKAININFASCNTLIVNGAMNNQTSYRLSNLILNQIDIMISNYKYVAIDDFFEYTQFISINACQESEEVDSLAMYSDYSIKILTNGIQIIKNCG